MADHVMHMHEREQDHNEEKQVGLRAEHGLLGSINYFLDGFFGPTDDPCESKRQAYEKGRQQGLEDRKASTPESHVQPARQP